MLPAAQRDTAPAGPAGMLPVAQRATPLSGIALHTTQKESNQNSNFSRNRFHVTQPVYEHAARDSTAEMIEGPCKALTLG